VRLGIINKQPGGRLRGFESLSLRQRFSLVQRIVVRLGIINKQPGYIRNWQIANILPTYEM